MLGSARIAPDDPRYDGAIDVGRRLAEAGFAVMTGGYGGLMEAVSRGAGEAGGSVIGLPVRRWPSLAPNPWITDTIWTDSFVGRLPHLATCDALVALDGGIGTLAELAVAWADRQTDPDVTPPLILVGPGWRAILDTIEHMLVVSRRDLELIRWVALPEDVVGAVLGVLGGPVPPAEPRG
ncbi:MAG: LOG family protein [Candidatus Limnocylindrales bacterium]